MSAFGGKADIANLRPDVPNVTLGSLHRLTGLESNRMSDFALSIILGIACDRLSSIFADAHCERRGLHRASLFERQLRMARYAIRADNAQCGGTRRNFSLLHSGHRQPARLRGAGSPDERELDLGVLNSTRGLWL